MKPLKIVHKATFFIIFAVLVGLGLYLLPRGTNTPVQQSDKPNVVVIVIDTLRAQNLSFNGYERETSPHMDALTAESIVFPTVTTNGGWTLPNVTTMLTGIPPEIHRVDEPKQYNTSQLLMLQERLQTNGYLTGGFSANYHIAKQNSFNQGFDTFYGPKERRDPYSYSDVTDLTRKAEKTVEAAQKAGKPFFVFMEPMNVHGAYSGGSEPQFIDETDGTFEYYGDLMDGIMRQNKLSLRDQVTEEFLQDLRNQYDSAIYYTDEKIQEFLDYLKEQGVYDNTIVVITADHGEEIYEREGFSHGYSLYNEIVNVPLIIKPQQTASDTVQEMIGQRYEHVGEHIDYLPTLLTLLNIDTEQIAAFPGQNLLQPNIAELQDPIYSQTRWVQRGIVESIVDWPYKLIFTYSDYQGKDNVLELYNMEEDPGELNDLSVQEPDRTAELQQQLKGIELQ